MTTFAPLPSGKFGIIYADPPWHYRFTHLREDKATLAADLQYPVIPTPDLQQLPVASIADDDCLLFLWAVSPKLQDAIAVGQAWGFKLSTVAFVWDKKSPLLGNYTMSQCELCLVFKRGRIPKPRGARNVRQFLQQKRGSHSQKPDEIRNRIAQMFPEQRKVELFARSRHKGWKSWGDQVRNGNCKTNSILI